MNKHDKTTDQIIKEHNECYKGEHKECNILMRPVSVCEAREKEIMNLFNIKVEMRLKNPRQKGNTNRRRAITQLESEGYLVDVTERTGKFVKVKDLFSLFDLIALFPIKEGDILFNKTVRLIQVKSNKFPPLKPFKDFADKYQQISVEIWCWKDRKGWEIKVI